MSIRLRPFARGKAVIASVILSFLSVGWKAINALSNADWILQSAGIKPEVAKFLASSRGTDLLMAATFGLLIISLVFTYERTPKDKQWQETPEYDLTDTANQLAAEAKKKEVKNQEREKVEVQQEQPERIIVNVTPEYLTGF